MGRGPLRLALFHEEIKSLAELARAFVVTPRFILRAVVKYGLEPFVLRDAASYTAHLRSADWIRLQSEVLRARPVCERTACDRPAAVAQHRRFDTIGRERPEDVEVLCHPCRAAINLGADVSASQLALFAV